MSNIIPILDLNYKKWAEGFTLSDLNDVIFTAGVHLMPTNEELILRQPGIVAKNVLSCLTLAALKVHLELTSKEHLYANVLSEYLTEPTVEEIPTDFVGYFGRYFKLPRGYRNNYGETVDDVTRGRKYYIDFTDREDYIYGKVPAWFT